ncbi:MAG: TetR/AcrR family transcriptional regulator [Desertimonas sp.]
MGRPATINRRAVALAALRLIDDGGLEALSLERIAAELGVRGPSLYHHFPDKAAILSHVAAVVLGDLEMERDVDDWRQWLVEVSLTFYRRVLEHPNAAAILMQFLPDVLALRGLAHATALLTAAEIEPSVQALLVEGCEKLSWGWALQRAFVAVGGEERRTPAVLSAEWPELAVALEHGSRRWSNEQILEAALYAFVDGVVGRYAVDD